MMKALLVSLFVATPIIWGQLPPATPERPCREVVSLFVPQFISGVPTTELERVEVRKCDAKTSERLQLVAWERKKQAPSLVVDTSDFTVTQVAMLGHVFVIETTGGPRDQVYVILYEAGRPKLAVQRVTKSRAQITTDEKSIRIKIPNTWSGKSELFSFPVD